jgi:hypothetical protein
MTYYVLIVSLWVYVTDDCQEIRLWAMQTDLSYEQCDKLKVEATPYIQMLDGELSCEVGDAV